MKTTTDGKPPAPGLEDAGAPQPVGQSGQHGAYWILTEEERAKGFLRPVRRSYKHVGPPGPRGPLRDLTDTEREMYAQAGYIAFEAYGSDRAPVIGRYWTQAQLEAIGVGCGTVTTMSTAIAETYARQPTFYGSTFCVKCKVHLKVGPSGEFVWMDERGMETVDRVGA